MKKSKTHRVMSEFNRGSLRSGSKSGPKIKSRKQAVAIALNEARRSGEPVPRKSGAEKRLRGASV